MINRTKSTLPWKNISYEVNQKEICNQRSFIRFMNILNYYFALINKFQVFKTL